MTLNRFTPLLILGLALTGAIAKGDPIVGSIEFGGYGTVTTDSNGNPTGFSSITAWTDPGTGTGDYYGIGFTTVTFDTFDFSDPSVTPLWTFTIGSVTYSFDATSIVNTSTGDFINLSGSGTASITGMDDTGGVWSITGTTGNDVSFTFGASTTVPDSGATLGLTLLGVAGIGLGLAGRRLARIIA